MKSAQLKILGNRHPNWERDPELALMDTVLNKYPELYNIIKNDYNAIIKDSILGRQDIPSIEQVVRAALYMKHRGIDYRKLVYDQYDSRICEYFLKLDILKPGFSKSTWQKYISSIKPETVEELSIEIAKHFVQEGFETVSKIRPDSTVVECNIHYPTNNSLVWDCIREAQHIIKKIPKAILRKLGIKIRNYTKKAKKHFYSINMMNKNNKNYISTFRFQLEILKKSINQLERIIYLLKLYLSKSSSKLELEYETLISLYNRIESLIPVANQIYTNSEKHEIKGERVENKDKIFSIYEQHTDIILKGGRKPEFGHKINMISGASSLILYCNIEEGNPSDTKLFKSSLDKVIETYGEIPGSIVSDGGYASIENLNYAKEKGICNIVFNKVVGRLQNIVSSKKKETQLKKWRSGMEAVISNLKRGFDLRRVNWKGKAHFYASVFWSVIAYNFRVMTRRIIESLIVAA